MAEFLFVRVVWDRQSYPLNLLGIRMHTLNIGPEGATHPFGRKGLALEQTWRHLSVKEQAGMLILDGDTVVDPHDVVMMFAAIEADPDAVHIAPAKIWPVSTGHPTWTWAHFKNYEASRELITDPDFFSFNFTYLPRALVEASIKAGLRSWVFPRVDAQVSRVARQQGFKIRVVEDCQPKHMHF